MHLDLVTGPVHLDQRQAGASGWPRPGTGARRTRNSPSPGGSLTARACSRNSSTAIGSGEKNAHRLNRCSASGVSSAVDMVQVAETEAGNSGSCSLSSRWAFSVEPAEVVVDALAGLGQVGRGVLDGDGQMTQGGSASRPAS